MIYVIQAEVGGPVKIGYTSGAPEARLRNLQCGSPFKLIVLATIPEGAVDEEANLHKRFQSSRLHGEWFELSDELVEWVSGLQAQAEPYPREMVRWRDDLTPKAALSAYTMLQSAGAKTQLPKDEEGTAEAHEDLQTIRRATRLIEGVYDRTTLGFRIEDPAADAMESLYSLEATLRDFLGLEAPA